MSWVTNTILVWERNWDYYYLDDVNAFFAERSEGFVSVEDGRLPSHWYGGYEHLECNIAIGAFNALDIQGLVKRLRELGHPCQLILRDQEDDRFRTIDILLPEE
jgi:hypothetical protein